MQVGESLGSLLVHLDVLLVLLVCLPHFTAVAHDSVDGPPTFAVALAHELLDHLFPLVSIFDSRPIGDLIWLVLVLLHDELSGLVLSLFGLLVGLACTLA